MDSLASNSPDACAPWYLQAILRALAQAPWRANLKIGSEDEVCVATLNVLLLRQKRSGYRSKGSSYPHSHGRLVARILEDVKSRQVAGCKVHFRYVSPDDPRHGRRVAHVRRYVVGFLLGYSTSLA